ncbi:MULTISPECIES: DUF2247 family protein [unclassified Bacillus (in: firmicutes)]|uniref:DUF2247 family protein n=1 Tax=unclassified Bacillus (in: firmicutes) TaxID=185979 RepID=UPI0008F1DD43|nr:MULTISPECIES: DUF2247 family protein [unclassified Bacillus (in: firmicutes)]SFH95550.1 hypothetical protein SAMN04488574_10140 [Bacillus sp. 71mf]SFS95021.1 hypothetical protein SAMN04488145_105250 [Bacillus sp. 103mf]
MDYSIDILKQSKIKYDWKTIYVGLELSIIKNNDITNYAVEFLSTHQECNNPFIIELAWGKNDIEYRRILKNILEELNGEELLKDSGLWKFEKRKWRFSILKHFKVMHQDEPKELLNKIVEVFADFDYPEDMERLINYMPSKDGYNPLLYSEEENIVRLISFFNDFLHKEQQYLQNRKVKR